MVPNLSIFGSSKILELDKFEGVDFKYATIFFQIATQKYPSKASLVQNSRIFIFAPNFATRQIRER